MANLINKFFFSKEKYKLRNAFLLSLLFGILLLLPVLLKNLFPSKAPLPNWERFIFAHLLFLAQFLFYLLHPSCRNVTKITRYTMGFLLLYLFGCLVSPWLTGYYRSFQELIKLESASSFFFLIIYCSYKEPRFSLLQAFSLIGCFIATAEAVLGLGQYILQSDLGLQWLGEKSLNLSDAVATVRLPGGVRWIFDENRPGIIEILRSYGTFDHPNHLGGFLVISLLLTCHLFLDSKRVKINKNIMIGALCLQSLALITTFSRSAWLGATIGIFILLCLRLYRSRGLAQREHLLLFALSASLCVAVVLFHLPIFHRCFPKYRSTERIVESLQSMTEQDVGDRGRFQGIAQKMIIQHPWKGVGFHEFVSQTNRFTEFSLWQHLPVHNIYLLVAAEVGLPAAISFIIFYILTAYRAMRNSEKEVLAAIWILCGLIGCVDNYFLTSQAGRLLLFSIAALALISRKKPTCSLVVTV